MNRYIKIGLQRRELLLVISIIGALFFVTSSVSAATTCTFNRDLQMGVVGEDVRCLQQYLNANGFVITTTGGGSPGKETTEFKTLTETALIKWQQANKLVPASGYFGPRSQQMYKTLAGGVAVAKPADTSSVVSGVDSSQSALLKMVDEIKTQLSGTIVKSASTSSAAPVATTDAKKLTTITKSLRDAEGKVADNDNADGYDDAVDSLADARDEFYRAVLAYLSGDAVVMTDALDSVKNSIADSLDSIDSNNQDLQTDLSDAKAKYKKAVKTVSNAIDDGDDVGDAEGILSDASKKLSKAQSAIDDGNDSKATGYIEDALAYIKEALNEF